MQDTRKFPVPLYKKMMHAYSLPFPISMCRLTFLMKHGPQVSFAKKMCKLTFLLQESILLGKIVFFVHSGW
jgi:hypothetical protein